MSTARSVEALTAETVTYHRGRVDRLVLNGVPYGSLEPDITGWKGRGLSISAVAEMEAISREFDSLRDAAKKGFDNAAVTLDRALGLDQSGVISAVSSFRFSSKLADKIDYYVKASGMRRLTCAHFPEQGETCLDVVGTFVDQRALIDAIQDFRAREACGELLKVDHFAGLPMVGQKRTCKALQNGGVVRQCGAAWQSRAVGEQLLGVAYLADNERPYRAGDHSARCLLGVAPMETEHYFGQDPVQGGWGARGQVMDAYRFAVMLVPHESELSR